MAAILLGGIGSALGAGFGGSILGLSGAVIGGGPHSTFLGCVRFPTCLGKAQLPREPSGRSFAGKRRR